MKVMKAIKRKKLSKGMRRHVRQEKARIRREFSDPIKQKELIDDFYNQLQSKKPTAPKPAKIPKSSAKVIKPLKIKSKKRTENVSK